MDSLQGLCPTSGTNIRHLGKSGTRSIAHGLELCRLRDGVGGLWGWQEPRAGWGWWDSPTSVGGAVLHPGQQLREENVLSRLLRRVPEQDLKERSIPERNIPEGSIPERSIPERSIPEDPSVTLRCHTGLVAQTAPPEQPRGSWDLIMALWVPVGWGNCPGSAP